MNEVFLKDLLAHTRDGEWGHGEPGSGLIETTVIRGTDFDDVRVGSLDHLPVRYVAERFVLSKGLKSGDIIIETAGGTKGRPTGRTLRISPDMLARIPTPVVCASFSRFLRPRPDCVNSSYLFWYLQYLYQTGATHKYNTQHTGVARFQYTTFSEREPLVLPPLPTQRKIAAILSAYDDLIESNTRRIAILDEMARNLYREWFVHFRFPGHQSVPMVESELGPIPEGWDVVPFGDLLVHHIGGGWGADTPNQKQGQAAYVIRGTDIPAARHNSVPEVPLRFHSESNLRSRRLHADDIVFEVSGGSKGQPVGRPLFITNELLGMFDADVICASFCKLLRINRDRLLPALAYLHLLEIYDNGRIERFQVQSTGITNFKFAHFLTEEELVIASSQFQSRFCDVADPLIRQVQNLGCRNNVLRRTRDLLLPRLVSGELDVSGLEIVIPEESA